MFPRMCKALEWLPVWLPVNYGSQITYICETHDRYSPYKKQKRTQKQIVDLNETPVVITVFLNR